MTDFFITLSDQFPSWLAVIFLASVPVLEIRGAIPFGVFVEHLPIFQTYLYAVIGNILPIIPLFFGCEIIKKIIAHMWPAFGSFIEKRVEKGKKALQKKYEQYGSVALCLFVAIPLPMTGVYTATFIAVAFGISFQKTFMSLCAGVCIAGIIVSILTMAGYAFTV